MYYYLVQNFINKYKHAFSDKGFIVSFIICLLALAAAFTFNYYTSIYATTHASNQVTDSILSNIPVYDVDMIFIYGPMFVWVFFIALLLHEPRRIPFALKSIALFIVIRAIFTTLTHLGPYPYVIPLGYNGDWVKSMTFGSDLFFSGHTGFPFLMALMFGKIHKTYYYIFIIASVFFGTIVLLGHYHYTIDVAAAFFITYPIYIIATKWFSKDREMFYLATVDHVD